MAQRPKVQVRKPSSASIDAAARVLEQRAEARQAAPAGRKLASSQARKPASSSPSRERGGWTKNNPYVRRDGTATRGTTIYLPVELADRLRRVAFEAQRSQSELVVEALEALLSRKGG